MASIESLKEQARRHEQREEWQKALHLYKQAIDRLAAEEQPDIGLYNRVGDLQTRLGNLGAAVEAYEEAVDLYVESGLPNNAIAVCKKIIRNMPLRTSVYLKMGQIRADQGFLVDARQSFLTYAERVQAAGDLDEALRALVEFADLSPDDAEIRLAVAGQMEQHGREEEAAGLLLQGYRILRRQGEDEEAAGVEARLREIDPELDVEEAARIEEVTRIEEAAGVEEEPGIEGAGVGGFETTSLAEDLGAGEGGDRESWPGEAAGVGALEEGEDGDEADAEGESGDGHPPAPAGARADDLEGEEAGEDAAAAIVEGFGAVLGEEEDEGTVAPELPLLDFGEEVEGEDRDLEALPTMSFDEGDPFDGEEYEEEAEPLPLLSFDEEDEGPGEALESAAEEARAEALPDGAAPDALMERGWRLLREGRVADAAALFGEARGLFDRADDLTGSVEATQALIEARPDDVAERQRLVELAFRTEDDDALVAAYLELARCLQRKGRTVRAQAVFQQVLAIDADNAEARAGLESGDPRRGPAREVASSEEYVDLGALVLGDEEEKTTRFVVAYEEPTGDEQADFTKMLSQFKQKVAENVAADDVKAHHDLGTAYKEMGLLDEAVEEFQQALRASAGHLPTFELLGQCFIEQGRHQAAVKTLGRALDIPFDVEDELLGIYYWLGRAHEALGNTDSAVEFYDRVFSLDINFADVTERLRALR